MIWSAASHSSSFERWLISPVWTRKAGGVGSALILAITSPSVAAGSGFAGLFEAEMGVADLHEGQVAFRYFGGSAPRRSARACAVRRRLLPIRHRFQPRPCISTAAAADARACGCFAVGMPVHALPPVSDMSDGQETGDAAGLFTAAEKIFDQPCGSAICLARIKHHSVGEPVEAAIATAVRASGPGENRDGRKPPRRRRGRPARPRQHRACRAIREGDDRTYLPRIASGSMMTPRQAGVVPIWRRRAR